MAHPASRLRALAAAFVAASVALVPAPSTHAAGEPASAAALVEISEWMTDPPDGQAEAEGEWVELVVVRAGSMAGISITDHDGAVDFTFDNASSPAAGDFLIVHNGQPTSPGVHGPGTHYFANKSSWTFDNGGDDLELLSASGQTLDSFAFGEGSAVDVNGGAAGALDERPPPGATLARVHGMWTASAPTPGAENVALQGAHEAPLLSTAWVSARDPIHFVICNTGDGPWVSFGWQLQLGNRSYLLAPAEVPVGSCMVFGPSPLSPVADAMGREFGDYVVQDARVDEIRSEAALELRDPWGTSKPLDRPPNFDALEGQSPVLWTTCGCPEIWRARALLEVSAAGAVATVSNVSIVEAGTNLSRAVMGLIENATGTLDVNAYLLTSDEVTSAITQAGARGAQVRLLLDGSPEGIARRDAMPGEMQLAALEAAGVEVRATAGGLAVPARDHAKYLVADRERVLILTENLVGAALSSRHPNTGYAASFDSPAIASQLRTLFDWDFASAASLTHASAFPAAQHAPPFDSTPHDDGSPAQLAISPAPSGAWAPWVQLIERAQAEVLCASLSADAAVLGPEGPVGQALLMAASRNVSVKVLLASPANNESKNGTADAARLLANEAAARNLTLEVRLDPRGANNESKMHAKVLVVDRKVVLLGSHNLVRAAAVANREVSIIIENAPAAAQLATSILGAFERALSLSVEGLAFDEGQSYGNPPAPVSAVEGLMAHPFYWVMAPGAFFAAWGGLRGRRRRRTTRIQFSAFWIGVAIARSLLRPRRRRDVEEDPPDVLHEEVVAPGPAVPAQPRRGEPPPLPPSAFDLMERE